MIGSALRSMFFATVLVAFASSQETGNVEEPANSCRQESFVHEPSFQIAEITTPALLLRDDGACPIMEDAKCLKGAKLAPGSEVLVAHGYNSLACVWFQPPDEVEKVGWIPKSTLKIKAPQPPNESWAGDWNDLGHNWIYIDTSPGTSQLRIAGHARWYGNNDVVHFGRVNGVSAPGVEHLSVSEGACTVYAHVTGRYLVVVDNARCGGANVRFDGIFQKRSVNAGYVPQDREGVVVGANIDLGQFTSRRLSGYPISPDLKEKLKPAAGLKGEDADAFLKRYPLQLTSQEAESLRSLVWNPLLNRLADQFNESKATAVPTFNKLPEEVQTVMADLTITFGSNFGAADRQNWGSDPKLWELLLRGSWPEVAAELSAKAAHLRKNFPDKLGQRLDDEADMLRKAIHRGALPKIERN